MLRVRKHRAPKGALRLHVFGPLVGDTSSVRKHRASKGALRPVETVLVGRAQSISQKAPSAKRCIKTQHPMLSAGEGSHQVRKHRAPKGPLRRVDSSRLAELHVLVRKHRAPNGALRHPTCHHLLFVFDSVRKHRAPKAALRPRTR